MNVQRRQHPHQIVAFEVLDLRELAGKAGDFGLGVIHFRLLFNHDGVDRRLRVLRFRDRKFSVERAFVVRSRLCRYQFLAEIERNAGFSFRLVLRQPFLQ